jgi:hypothetical protein
MKEGLEAWLMENRPHPAVGPALALATLLDHVLAILTGDVVYGTASMQIVVELLNGMRELVEQFLESARSPDEEPMAFFVTYNRIASAYVHSLPMLNELIADRE